MREMQPIIDPIPVEKLKAELTPDLLLRKTNKAGNEIYIVDNTTSPNVLLEIGRLREIAFRTVGCGIGTPCDLDCFDLEDPACKQIVLWNPDAEEIIGGYRFTPWAKATMKEDGQPWVSTEHIFKFSEEFLRTDFASCIELGRAFIQPKYQNGAMGHKAVFALDNIWDGIGALLANNPEVKYLCGKLSIYDSASYETVMAMIFFMKQFLEDNSGILIPKNPAAVPAELQEKFKGMFTADNIRDNFKVLTDFAKENGDRVPPLIHSYLELSSSMRTFGTVLNDDFGNAYDTGMMIAVQDIYPKKWNRYVQPYLDGLNKEE